MNCLCARSDSKRESNSKQKRALLLWNKKLKNMHTILTAEDGISKWRRALTPADLNNHLDEFERDFKRLREDLRETK